MTAAAASTSAATSSKISSEQLDRMLSIALLAPMDDPYSPHCRWGAPILLWGPPGIGKSGRIEQASETVGLRCETLYLSTLQPEDVSGVPMKDEKSKTGARRVIDLPQIVDLYEQGSGVLFLDELTTARPAIQGAGLGVVYNRKVAGRPLPGGVRVIGAANPPEEAAGGWDLAPPMANRLLHLEVGVPSVDEWTSWLLTGGDMDIISVHEGEARIKENWNEQWAKLRGLGAGFMRRSQDSLYKMPPAGNRARSRAWPSPRSWEVALRCVATANILGMPELGVEMLAASCGSGPTTAWLEWLQYANLPDPKDVLEHGWKPDKRRLDIAFAVYSSAISYALGKKDNDDKKKHVIMAYKLLDSAIKENLSDVAMAPAVSLMRAGFTSKAGPDVAAASHDLVAHLGKSGLANYVRRAP